MNFSPVRHLSPCPSPRLARSGTADPPLSWIPTDVLLHVWRNFCDFSALVHCEQVCLSWARLLNSREGEALWRAHALRLWAQKQPPVVPLPVHVSERSWKRQFALRLQDARRTRLTAAELTAADWHFRFKIDLQLFHSSDRERGLLHSRERAKLNFAPDGVYTSTIPGAPSSSRPLKWSLQTSGEDTLLQIGAYPPLLVERTADWGWRMYNRFVEFYTVMDGCR